MTNPQQPAEWQDPLAAPPPPAAFPAPEPVTFPSAPAFAAPVGSPADGIGSNSEPTRPISVDPAPPAGADPSVSPAPQPGVVNPYANPADPYVVAAAPYGYAQPGGYGYAAPGGYGYPQPGYPGYPVSPPTNGMAIGSLVVSIAGLTMLTCYGLGALIGLVGAILGHVSRKQIRERGEGGDGLALAGMVVGWATVALGLLIVGFFVVMFISFASMDPTY